MGLRDRLRAANHALNGAALRAITPSDFGRALDVNDDWFDTRAGEPVTLDTVLGIQHVWACVSLLVNDIRKLPADVFRDVGEGRRVPITAPAWMRYPDPADTNTRFRDHVAQAVLSLLVDGNAFLYAWPSVYNVERLLVLDPTKVDVKDSRFIVKGYDQPLSELNVRHVRNLVKPGARRGMNPIAAAREGFGLTLAAEQFGQRFFTNGAIMSGVIEAPPGAVVDADKLKAEFNKRHDAKKRAHAVGVLTGGATFRSLSFSPEDTQFLALRKYQLEDAARLFHIPPFKIGSTEPGAVAYASTSNARIDYVQSAVEPIVVLLEDAYSDLVPGDDTYVKFNLNALLRGDPAARYVAYNTMLQAGVITKDEVRRWEDWGPADDAVGVATVNGGYLRTPQNTAPQNDEIASLIEQVKAGLRTENEAREKLNLPPIEYSEGPGPEEMASVLEQLKAGVLTHEEVREMLGRQPVEWSDDLGPEDIASLVEQVKAGLLTENEARELLKRPPMEWAEGPSRDDIDTLVVQVKEGLLTIEEARESLGRPPVEWPEDLSEKVEQAETLIKAGFDPADVLAKLGLPPMKHLGLPPVTVQKLADAEGDAAPPDAAPPAEAEPEGVAQ